MSGSHKKQYDTSVLRPQIVHDDIRLRGRDLAPAARTKIRKVLRTLHSLETMAVDVWPARCRALLKIATIPSKQMAFKAD